MQYNKAKATHFQANTCTHKLFEEQVDRSPDQIAVICKNQQLTYKQLNTRANQLAHHLQAVGVAPEVLIGLYMERSLEVLIGILGILKAGGAYVPLDPAYPKKRLRFMAENARVSVILTQERLKSELPTIVEQVLYIDTDWLLISQQSEKNPTNSASSVNLAYVIYTSGSTGKPQGVMVTHANLCNYLQVLPERLGITSDDIYLHTASIAFSSSVRQFMVPLCKGATVVIATVEQRANPLLLFEAIKRQNVTILDIVPSYWRNCSQILASLDLESRQKLLNNQLRLIVSASEPLRSDITRNWTFEFKHGARLVNMYGQTETTGIIAVYDIPPQDDDRVQTVRIGHPLPNSQIYILDQEYQPVPIGVPGELCIGGSGLARGYLNCSELTAKAFIPNPFSDDPESRLYKTEDLVRQLPDGTFEFLGRSDYQVKIRGYRIELGEIESKLLQHPAVREVVVIAREDVSDEQRLVAYIVFKPEQVVKTTELRHFLKEQLPVYMVPSAFVMLDALPLNPNGKIDRTALPAPDSVRQEPEETFVAPRDELELQLTLIWQRVFGIQSVGITDNFFDLGGHSLIAVRLFTEIEKSLARDLPLATLFQAQTIEELADVLRQETDSKSWSSLVLIQPGGSKPPLFCIHPIGGNILEYYPLANCLGREQPIYGLQAQGLDGKQAPLSRVEDMAKHYIEEIRTIQPDGPYFLTGYSFGGLVAFEIAQQLYVQGQKVGWLALLDARNPNFVEPNRSFAKFVRVHLSNLRQLDPKGRLRYVKDWVQWQLNKGNYKDFVLSQLSEPLKSANVIESNSQAAKDYRPKVYPEAGVVTLFRSSLQPVKFADHLDLGWGELVAGGNLEIHHIPGDHYGLLREPLVRVLAEKLKFCLEQARADDARFFY